MSAQAEPAEPAWKLTSKELLVANVEIKSRTAHNNTRDALNAITDLMRTGPEPSTDQMSEIEELLASARRTLELASEQALEMARKMIRRDEP